jgi:hypothetical protein
MALTVADKYSDIWLSVEDSAYKTLIHDFKFYFSNFNKKKNMQFYVYKVTDNVV